nr:DUF308 domain-containing protein [uncultured Blautia sp.]
MRRRSGFGWLEFIEGLLLILLGIFTCVRPGSILEGFVVLYGLLAVVTGIGDIVFYVKMERHMGFGPSISLIAGLLSVMAGFMLLVHPDAGKWIIALLVPIWFIAHCITGSADDRKSGIFRIFHWRAYGCVYAASGH